MPKLVNNSTYAITVVDTLLSPGQPKNVSEEVYNNPEVQRMLKERVVGSDEFVLSVRDEEGGEEDESEDEEDEEEVVEENKPKSVNPNNPT